MQTKRHLDIQNTLFVRLFLNSIIDGTVAGTPADLTIYRDTTSGYWLRDKTYYGRGCNNGWGTDGAAGSVTPCSDSDGGGRYVKTADDETQKNGTYYHFQAATVGTGGAIETHKADSSDTFCPLGWQLPYSGTDGDYDDKSKSWNHLFKSYSLHIGEGTSTSADATKVKSYPLSYVYSGFYYWVTGRLYHQSVFGDYWSSTIVNGLDSFRLYLSSDIVRTANSFNKSIGFNLRCFFHRRHGGRNRYIDG